MPFSAADEGGCLGFGSGSGSGSRSWLRLRALWAAALLVTLVALVLLGNVAVLTLFDQSPERLTRPLTHDADLFAQSLWQTASQTTEPRGIVLPLFDDIALLGFSLILELRAFGVELPIEVPHCGDLDPALADRVARRDQRVRFYDACELAADATDDFYPGRKLFCADVEHCHSKFRGFDIKILGVVYSKFEQVMLLDADTMFFENPTQLWDTKKYRDTGTLFFLDRMTSDGENLAAPVDGDHGVRITAIHAFLSSFDIKPFRNLETLARAEAADQDAIKDDVTPDLPVAFPFTPSREIRLSHAWRMRTGHFLDSSVLLWNKRRQPRATAILASFVSMNGARRPPSYGDKELFFQACELAESAYAVSDFGVGTIGAKWFAEEGGSLCGDQLHFLPENASAKPESAAPLYINSDSILTWDPRRVELFRTVGRLADVYPGNYKQLGFPISCLFGVDVMPLAPELTERFLDRQQLHERVVQWFREDLHSWWLLAKLELRRWLQR